MDFTVVKGNPSEEELAALTLVFAELQAAATTAEAPTQKNLWGAPQLPGHRTPVFNPGAFSNVTYF